jgi:hypothetical protein
MFSAALAFASLLVAARAQLAGTNTAETHPALTVSQCTASGCDSCSYRGAISMERSLKYEGIDISEEVV